MPRRDFLCLGSLTGTGAFLGWRTHVRAGAMDDLGPPAAYQKMADKIRHLFTAKTPPGPGDWLKSHPEPGQTFAQYARTNPNRPKDGRNALYLVELDVA